MAYRFQRRIKIAPGLRVNVSKGGVSLSAGPRGASMTLGKRGLYGNVGVPGTGMSYREKLNGRKASPRDAGGGSSKSVLMKVDDDGNFYILDESGQELPESVIRQIKRSNGNVIRDFLAGVCNSRNELLATITSFHQEIPPPTNTPKYKSESFTEEKPEKSFWLMLFGLIVPGVKRRHQVKLDEWHERKVAFEKEQSDRRELEETLVFTSLEAMDQVLADYLNAIEWPDKPEIDYDLGMNNQTLAIDILLPGEDGLPDKKWSIPGNAYRLNSKRLTETRRRQLYRDYAHSVLLRIIGEVYARLPTVEHVMVSAYRKGMDAATAHDSDEYIVSVITHRSKWCKMNFDRISDIDPVEALSEHTLKRNMTKTGIFKPVSPFIPDDLERVANPT